LTRRGLRRIIISISGATFWPHTWRHLYENNKHLTPTNQQSREPGTEDRMGHQEERHHPHRDVQEQVPDVRRESKRPDQHLRRGKTSSEKENIQRVL